jgi:hypothetical protein
VLPPLSSKGRGRGKGQLRYYAVDPSRQLLELLGFRRRGHGIAECAVRLWLNDYAIDVSDVRRHLPRALKSVYRFRRLMASPRFATEFAEYLHRTPHAREMWFGDRTWTDERYDDAVNIGSAMSSRDRPAPSHLTAAATRVMNLTVEERSLIVALGGDPDTILQDTLPTFYRIFESLNRSTDSDFHVARNVHRKLVVLDDIARRIAGLLPNVISSLITRISEPDELHSSYGLFLAFGMLTISNDDDGNILENLDHRANELRTALNHLELQSVQGGMAFGAAER